MTTIAVHNILSKLSKNDIVEMGEDSDGNEVFAIRIGDNYSTLTMNNLDSNDLDT